MTIARTLSIILLLTSATASAASPPEKNVMLLPIDKWHVDTRQLGCGLTRAFGDDDNRVDFALDLDELGRARLSLALEADKRTQFMERAAFISLPPTKQKIAVSASIASSMTAADRYSMMMDLRADDLATLTQAATEGADEMIVRVGDRRIELLSGPIKRALGTLIDCRRALVKSWGADPDAMTVAEGGDIPWFRDSDLPPDIRKSGVGGLTIAAVSIDRAGKPTGCRLFVVTGTAAIDALACADIMTRGRFKAARTDDAAVRWSIVSHLWPRRGR